MSAPFYIEEKFKGFISKTYPDAARMDADQYHQLRIAFFGGALIALRATCSEDDLYAELIRFRGEILRLASQSRPN